MIIERKWAMPNKETFKIKPIAELLKKYIKESDIWLDPFSGKNSPATYTNDLNPKIKADFHEEALTFLEQFENKEYDGILFDPPYSLRQIKECYDSIGIKMTYEKTIDSLTSVKDKISKLIKPGGICISFGWNSGGLGKNRGFKIVEILLIPHGGYHNDTICVVEVKEQTNLF